MQFFFAIGMSWIASDIFTFHFMLLENECINQCETVALALIRNWAIEMGNASAEKLLNDINLMLTN